jgi:hypothetical protein
MDCTNYIYDEKYGPRDFVYSLYMACTAYIDDETVGPETLLQPLHGL